MLSKSPFPERGDGVVGSRFTMPRASSPAISREKRMVACTGCSVRHRGRSAVRDPPPLACEPWSPRTGWRPGPCSTGVFLKLHSPAWSQMGQSSGWLMRATPAPPPASAWWLRNRDKSPFPGEIRGGAGDGAARGARVRRGAPTAILGNRPDSTPACGRDPSSACRIRPNTCGSCRRRKLGVIAVMRHLGSGELAGLEHRGRLETPCQSGIIFGTSISRPSHLDLERFSTGAARRVPGRLSRRSTWKIPVLGAGGVLLGAG